MKNKSLSLSQSLLPFNELPASNKQINKRKTSVRRKLIDRCFNKDDLMKPLLEGWRREIVVRGISSHDRKDVYYYAPCGTKLRSAREVEKLLIEKGSPFTPRNFSFAQVIMGFPHPYEVCRNAAMRLETKIKTCSSKPLLLNKQNKTLPAKPRKLSKVSLHVDADLPSQSLGYKLGQYSKCIQKNNEMSSSDYRFAGAQDKPQQKKVLYIEELKEETISPTYSSGPLSTTLTSLKKSNSPKTLHSSPHRPYRHSMHRSTSKKTGNASSAPPVPMFQLKLDDVSNYAERGEDCSRVAQSDVSNLGLDSAAKVPSRIRVRPIEELCRMDNGNAKSPSSLTTYTNQHLNKAPSNIGQKESYLFHPSSKTFFKVNPLATAPPSDSSTVEKNNQNKLSNTLMDGQQPVFYMPSFSPNISVNVRFNVPESSTHSYPQTKANDFLTNPVNEVYGSHVNTWSRYGPSNKIISNDSNSVLQKNSNTKLAQLSSTPLSKLGSLDSPQSSPFIIQSNINSDPLNHGRISASNAKLINENIFRDHSIANPTHLPYSCKNQVLLSYLSTPSDQAPLLRKGIRSLKANSNISFKSPQVKLPTITPSVAKVGSISVDDWLSIQD